MYSASQGEATSGRSNKDNEPNSGVTIQGAGVKNSSELGFAEMGPKACGNNKFESIHVSNLPASAGLF